MKNKFILTLFYIIFFFNSNVLGENDNKSLKIGLLAPLSGSHSQLGNSLLYSLQLALEEINDKNVYIIPRDSGFNNKEKLNNAIQDIKSQGIRIIIGPITYDEFNEVKKYSDLIFISPSNINPEFTNNVISVGISLESQLLALIKFIKKMKKNKTVIMYPKNKYADLIRKKIRILNLDKMKIFEYSSNPEVLTGEIEVLTNYDQRKKNLELRKKVFKEKDDEESQAELMYLAAVPRQIISPQNNASIVGIFQDSMLGSARFTRKDINFDNRHAMNLLMKQLIG